MGAVRPLTYSGREESLQRYGDRISGRRVVVAFLVAAAMNLFAYWRSDKMVLSMYGAREGNERAAPELYGLVGQLAREAELPMPRVYIMDNPQPNAFATGRNPEHATVAVTTGLLQRLNRDELAGACSRMSSGTSSTAIRCS